MEASRSKGSGKLTVTGQLGEVMLESVRTAMYLGARVFTDVGWRPLCTLGFKLRLGVEIGLVFFLCFFVVCCS